CRRIEEERKAACEREGLGQDRQSTSAATALSAGERAEVEQLKQELATLRQQLYDRYRERRDRLGAMQESIRKAAEKVQEQKRQLNVEVSQAARLRNEDEVRRAEVEARAEALARERQLLETEVEELSRKELALEKELAQLDGRR